jgi:hypothetical protein
MKSLTDRLQASLTTQEPDPQQIMDELMEELSRNCSEGDS